MHKVGVVLDGDCLGERSVEVIRLLSLDTNVDLCWIGLVSGADLGQGSPSWLLRFALWFDEKVKRGSGRIRERCVALDELGLATPVVEVGDWSRQKAKNAAPDIVMLLSTKTTPGEIAETLGACVWVFASKKRVTRGSSGGPHTSRSRSNVDGVYLLEISTHPDRPATILGFAESRVSRTSLLQRESVLRTASIRVLADALARLSSGGGFLGSLPQVSKRDLREAIDDFPHGLEVARWVVGSAYAGVRSRLGKESRNVQQWSIGIAGAHGCDWREGRFQGLQWQGVSEDRMVADPCLVEKEGRVWLFMEELHYREGRGFISVMDPTDPGGWRNSEPVLKMPFHLSFPRVFEFEGEHFMLPEQIASGELVLYRSHGFPRDWRPHAILLRDTKATDPVLIRRDGYWWLFFSRGDYGSTDNNTQLYFAAELDGPYVRHPMSPVHEGLLGSRMAGEIFVSDGALIRPVQDCRRSYGAAFAFREIIDLSPDTYSERELLRVPPDPTWPFAEGSHSYSSAGGLVALDGRRSIRRHGAAQG